MIYLYGIPNCGSVKKARKLLEDNNVAYTFVDFKKTPPTDQQIKNWLDKVGAEKLINKKGTKWRTLTDEEKQLPAATVITQYPTVIKRPLIEWENGTITVGFDENDILHRV
ncbi:MAG: Spx/MgsR family RNA polymerase-binding regulatory protein [Neisseriaceae bacterium]|nr:Spx/MgsR family RNA polymerase-binding regulatory protein [Neisseriaceae bacterium]